MSSQNTVNALSWRRLHLARAKLKAISRTSALLSGFAMVVLVESDLKPGLPNALLITFSVCTTLVVAIHLLALMISTCILPNMEAVSNIHNITAVQESPHEKMQCYIEMAWIFSTGLGILLFLLQMAILAWVRFYNPPRKVKDTAEKGNCTTDGYEEGNNAAAIASTVVIVPAILAFIAFAVHFYRQLIAHKYERSQYGLEELQTMAEQLDGRMGNVQTV